MKFLVLGADAASGTEREIFLDAETEMAAVATAKSLGIFVSRITKIATEATRVKALHSPALTHVSATKQAFDPTTPLSATRFIFGMLEAVAGVIVGIAVTFQHHDADYFLGGIVLVSGLISGMLLMAISSILESLRQSVHELRRIANGLEK